MAETFRHRCESVIRFGDLDIMGHANNVALLRLFETGRIDYIVDLGLAQHNEPSFTLVAIQYDFLNSAKYRDQLACGTKTERIGKSSLVLRQAISRDDGTPICSGTSVIAALDPDMKRSRPLPNEWMERIRDWEGRSLERTEGQDGLG